jgi:hypothetical protein
MDDDNKDIVISINNSNFKVTIKVDKNPIDGI